MLIKFVSNWRKRFFILKCITCKSTIRMFSDPVLGPRYVLYGVLKQHLSTAVLNVHKTYGPFREKTKAQTSLCIRSGLEITQLLQRPSAAVQSVGKDHFLVGKRF